MIENYEVWSSQVEEVSPSRRNGEEFVIIAESDICEQVSEVGPFWRVQPSVGLGRSLQNANSESAIEGIDTGDMPEGEIDLMRFETADGAHQWKDAQHVTQAHAELPCEKYIWHANGCSANDAARTPLIELSPRSAGDHAHRIPWRRRIQGS
jgi:hypothetical protein